jgi:glycerophosphoryl diester phosphodiesterase
MLRRSFLSSFGLVPAAILAEADAGLALPGRGLCAHRGAMSTHPENTLPGLLEAVRLKAQMIEFDLQLSRDGRLVLMHDSTVDRTTNGSGKVGDLSFAELRQLDAGGWMDPRFVGTRIPTFEEVLEVMPGDIWLNCHLKGEEAVGKAAARVIADHGRLHQAFLAAGRAAAEAAKKAVPGILICNMERQSDSMAYAADTVERGCAFIQLRGKGEIHQETIDYLLKHQVRINYYHDESPEGLRRLWRAGVHFPLVNDLSAAIRVAQEEGILPV